MTGDDRHLRLVVEHDQGPVGRGITPLMPINRGDFDTAGNPIQRIEVQTTRSRGQLRRRLTPALNDRCWPDSDRASCRYPAQNSYDQTSVCSAISRASSTSMPK